MQYYNKKRNPFLRIFLYSENKENGKDVVYAFLSTMDRLRQSP